MDEARDLATYADRFEPWARAADEDVALVAAGQETAYGSLAARLAPAEPLDEGSRAHTATADPLELASPGPRRLGGRRVARAQPGCRARRPSAARAPRVRAGHGVALTGASASCADARGTEPISTLTLVCAASSARQVRMAT